MRERAVLRRRRRVLRVIMAGLVLSLAGVHAVAAQDQAESAIASPELVFPIEEEAISERASSEPFAIHIVEPLTCDPASGQVVGFEVQGSLMFLCSARITSSELGTDSIRWEISSRLPPGFNVVVLEQDTILEIRLLDEEDDATLVYEAPSTFDPSQPTRQIQVAIVQSPGCFSPVQNPEVRLEAIASTADGAFKSDVDLGTEYLDIPSPLATARFSSALQFTNVENSLDSILMTSLGQVQITIAAPPGFCGDLRVRMNAELQGTPSTTGHLYLTKINDIALGEQTCDLIKGCTIALNPWIDTGFGQVALMVEMELALESAPPVEGFGVRLSIEAIRVDIYP